MGVLDVDGYSYKERFDVNDDKHSNDPQHAEHTRTRPTPSPKNSGGGAG